MLERISEAAFWLGRFGVVAVVLLGTGPMPAQIKANEPWAFSLTVDGFAVPHSKFYVSPTFAADRKWLHLEARYNYENQKSGSLWVGYNFSAGKTAILQATPMAGVVLGRTAGIAPGLLVSLTYKRLEFSSSSEYVFDLKNRSANFFYSWPQVTYSPRDWLRVGLVAQRTKAYKTDLDLQRGVLVGFSVQKLSFTTYIFNIGWGEPTLVFETGFSF